MFRHRFVGEPGQLAGMRRRVSGWGRSTSIRPYRLERLLLAVNEAATEAIEQAQAEHCPTSVVIEFATHADRITVTVAASGVHRRAVSTLPIQGRADRAGDRAPGLPFTGLALLRRLVDRADMTSSASGTKVTLVDYDGSG